jgi:hypothetical protein
MGGGGMKTQESFDDIWERSASPEEYAADKNILSFIIGLNRLLERHKNFQGQRQFHHQHDDPAGACSRRDH